MKHLLNKLGLKAYATTAYEGEDGLEVLHHGNLIARYRATDRVLEVWNAGWYSKTTKDRLNAVLGYYNAGWIQQRDWVWYLHTDDGESVFDGYAKLSV